MSLLVAGARFAAGPVDRLPIKAAAIGAKCVSGEASHIAKGGRPGICRRWRVSVLDSRCRSTGRPAMTFAAMTASLSMPRYVDGLKMVGHTVRADTDAFYAEFPEPHPNEDGHNKNDAENSQDCLASHALDCRQFGTKEFQAAAHNRGHHAEDT
jgi:hypothetical protein